ncbi:MAG: MFS transporter, partial [Pseudomonadota bacterium]|nr:MFS transporter [Pseudomonadota bacterium]
VDRFPLNLMLVLSLALGALLSLAYAYISSFLVLLVARCLWGLCWSFIRHISVMGVVSSTEPQNLGQMMGFYNGISRIGCVPGTVLGGILFDLIGFSTTLALFCLFSLFAVPFAMRSGVQTSSIITDQQQNNQSSTRYSALLCCGFCIGSVGPGLIMSTLGFILLSQYGTEVVLMGFVVGIATLNGLLLGCRFVLETLGAPIYGALIDRTGIRLGAPLCFLVGLIVMLLLNLSENLAGLALGMIVFFMCGTALSTVVSAEASRLGAKVFARYATAGDLGAAFGPVIGWGAYELIGTPNFVFVLGAGLYAIGMFSTFAAFRLEE